MQEPKGRILLVEDESDTCRSIKEYMELDKEHMGLNRYLVDLHTGYEFMKSGNGIWERRKAIDILLEGYDDYCVAVLDLAIKNFDSGIPNKREGINLISRILHYEELKRVNITKRLPLIIESQFQFETLPDVPGEQIRDRVFKYFEKGPEFELTDFLSMVDGARISREYSGRESLRTVESVR